MSRILKKFCKSLVLVLALAFVTVIFNNARVAAAGMNSEEFFARILVNNAEECYKKALVSEMSMPIDFGSSSDKLRFNSFMNEGYKQSASPRYTFNIPALRSLETGYNNITIGWEDNRYKNEPKASCYALFAGDRTGSGTLDGRMTGIFDIYGKKIPENTPSASVTKQFMNELLQYKIDTTNVSSKEYCYTVWRKGKLTTDERMPIATACKNESDYTDNGKLPEFSTNFKFDKNIDSSMYEVVGGFACTSRTHTGACHGPYWSVKVVEAQGKSCTEINGHSSRMVPCEFEYKLGLEKPTGNSDVEIRSNWKDGDGATFWMEIEERTTTGEDAELVSYKKDNTKFQDFIKALTGKDWNDFKFSDADKYNVYWLYLTKNYGDGENPIASGQCQQEKPTAVADTVNNKFYVYSKGHGWCLASLTESKLGESFAMTVFSKNNNRTLDKVIYTLPDLIRLMADLDYSDESGLIDTNGVVNPGEDGDNDEAEATCANSGAAGSLGWIVCPILDRLVAASANMYDTYVEPALRVDPKLFAENSGDSDDAKDAWKIFQNIANILFVILFMVVIFSQLTGYGIDNYGIKKILPKLVVVAILVNLSYYICLICVDLSNIFGNGLRAILDGIASGMNIPAIPRPDGTSVPGAGATAISAVALLGMLFAVGVAVWKNPAILLTLLVSALGVTIAILFLFILLSAREAAIVILTVISPLAFTCYMLPNTKKLFEKWLKMGEGLLLVYPICGLLVGGGNFASKLLLAAGTASESNGFFQAFTAMLVGIIPIFFIPAVLKGSFAAMGNLGSKISGLGEKMRGGVTKGIRNTDAYKRRQTRMNAGTNKYGQLTGLGRVRARVNNSKFGKAIGADRRQATYIAQAKKEIDASEEAGAILTKALARTDVAKAQALPDTGEGGELGSDFESGNGAYYGGQFLAAATRGDIVSMNSAIGAMRSSGMKAKNIAKLLRYAQNNGYMDSLDKNTRKTWWEDTYNKYGNDFMATDFELNHFARMGGVGVDSDGRLGGYGEYAGRNAFEIEDVKPEDIIKLSGDSLAGMISAGKIDQGLAQRVMAMNPNITSDRRIMLGALASGLVGAGVNAAALKKDASALSGNRNATTNVITTANAGGGGEDLATLVARWTAPTAQRATVVQEFFGDEDKQIRPVEIVDVDINRPGPHQ